jgi:exopolyphosphatase/guanosine-5'-triphosphate,3'-diphosphate pyrophosphatase
MSELQDTPIIAAVDLGSNSFHLTLAKLQHSNLQILGRLKEKVRLVAGLTADGTLDQAAQQRALECLAQFRQRLQGMQPHQVRAVGTYALRKAKNAREFLQHAQHALGFPIEVISGREEARLIYEGVAHFQHSEAKQLVVDIGGGSTEFAIGEAFEPVLLDSLQMGCVSYTQRFFNDGLINKANFKSAIIAARLELMSIQDLYLREGWDLAIGTSGTIESILELCGKLDFDNQEVTLECLQQLKSRLLSMERLDAIQLDGLADNRREILPAGLAILIGIFKALKIERMRTSPAALREGILFELAGIEKTFDIRERAIKGLLTRYHIDFDQARRVNQTALHLWQQLHTAWDISDNFYRQMLSWAARCHEIGLAVNYSKQQKHGEYLLRNTDINGFSLQQQQMLALLVRSFRRKFPLHRFEVIDDPTMRTRLIRLARILRLAVLLNHRRRDYNIPPFEISVIDDQMTLTFPAGYLKEHSLLKADLEQEQKFLNAVNLSFIYH